MMWRPCREALLAAGVFALVSLFLTEAAADRQFEPPVRLEEQVLPFTLHEGNLKIYSSYMAGIRVS